MLVSPLLAAGDPRGPARGAPHRRRRRPDRRRLPWRRSATTPTSPPSAPTRPPPVPCQPPGWTGVASPTRPPWSPCPRGHRSTSAPPPRRSAPTAPPRRRMLPPAAAVLVSLGGDIAVAGTPPAGGWPVRVTDDHAAQRRGARAGDHAAHGGGLATSSSTRAPLAPRRRGTLHHIVDPRTGAPAQSPVPHHQRRRGHVCGRQHASTAAMVRGERAAGWLEFTGLPARLVAHDGVVLHLNRWPVSGGAGGLIAASGPTALWYAARSTGYVSLLLLTAILVLGIVTVDALGQPGLAAVPDPGACTATCRCWCWSSWPSTSSPRSSTPSRGSPRSTRWHRSPAPTAPCGSGSGWSPWSCWSPWSITSLLRQRIGFRVWRVVHWAAYACWPLAMLHTLGTGSDVRSAVGPGRSASAASGRCVFAIVWRLTSDRGRACRGCCAPPASWPPRPRPSRCSGFAAAGTAAQRVGEGGRDAGPAACRRQRLRPSPPPRRQAPPRRRCRPGSPTS